MNPKNIARRLLLVLLVIAMLVPLVTSVMAYPQWNGTGTGGGNATSSAGDSAYAIVGENATQMIVGYRFTGLTANGRRANNADSLDVFARGKEEFLTNGQWQRVRAQYNKYEYVQAFKIKSADNKAEPLDEGTTNSPLRCRQGS